MNANEYVNRVREHLPRETPEREQIAMELQGHIAERVAQGQSLDTVLAQLGAPETLAESYLAEVPLEPAPHASRILAKIIDLAAVAAVVGLVVVAAFFVVPRERFPLVAAAGVMAAGLIFLIYTIIAEQRRGQTIGKRMQGLHVVTESGAPIGIGQSVVRQLPFALSIIFIDAIFALFTDRRQRAFEVLSKTRVVRSTGKTRAA